MVFGPQVLDRAGTWTGVMAGVARTASTHQPRANLWPAAW